QRRGAKEAAEKYGVSLRTVQNWLVSEPPHQVTVDAVAKQAEVVLDRTAPPPLPRAVAPAPLPTPPAPKPLLQIVVPGELIARYGVKMSEWVERADHDASAREALKVVGEQYRDLLELVIFARAEGTSIDNAIVDSVNGAIEDREASSQARDGEASSGCFDGTPVEEIG